MVRSSETILITGAAKRIGKGVARFLAKSRYNIALHYNNSSDEAKAVAEEIRGQEVRCEIFQCDLSDEKESAMLISRVKETFPDLRILINNASIFDKGSITESDTAFLMKNFAVNFFAPYILSKAFRQEVEFGHIINMLDSRIDKNEADYAAYTMSKKALADFTRLASVEFAPQIRVNAVIPGFVLPPEGATDTFYHKRASAIPLQKNGTINDIAHAIKYLLKNEYVTGQFMYIDGGEHL